MTDETRWYYASDADTVEGPVGWASLCAMRRARHLTEETLVWCDELPDWIELRTIVAKRRPSVPPLPVVAGSVQRTAGSGAALPGFVAHERGAVPAFLEEVSGDDAHRMVATAARAGGGRGEPNAAFAWIAASRREGPEATESGLYEWATVAVAVALIVIGVLAVVDFI